MKQLDKYDDSSNSPTKRKSILKNNYVNMNESEKKKVADKIENEVNNSMKIKTEKRDKVETNDTINFSKYNRIKEIVNVIFEHDAYRGTIMSIIFFCIFADDFRMGFLNATWDLFIDIFLILFLIFFGIELALFSVFKYNYLFTFYFYIDLLSFLSVFIDIQLFFEPYNNYNTYRLNYSYIRDNYYRNISGNNLLVKDLNSISDQ